MATITSENGRGITVPTWLLATISGAILSTCVVVGGSAISTWDLARAATQKNQEQDLRLDKLEALQVDVAGMKADLATTKDLAKATNEKIDQLLLSRQYPAASFRERPQ